MTEKYTPAESLLRLMRVMRRRPRGSDGGNTSHGYYKLLKCISLYDGANMRELVEIMDMRPPSLTERLARLERDGVITKEKDERDLRAVRIWINDAGRKKLEDIEEREAKFEDFSDILTYEELKEFTELCDRLREGLEKRLQDQAESQKE